MKKGRGRTGSPPCPGCRSWICGAPFSRLSTQSLWCLFSTILCRRWWNSCRMSCAFSTCFSACSRAGCRSAQRSCVHPALLAQSSVRRRWLTSWWKCRRLYPSWLQLRMEQNVDIPVPGRGGRISGLQGFLPRQCSTALQGPLERISERIVEQKRCFPCWLEASKIFSQDRVHLHLLHLQLVFMVLQMGLVKVFFALFSDHAGSSCGRVVWGGACGQVPAAL